MVAGNQTFPIYNSDGSSFNGLELKKSVYDSVVMSLGDKITGDVYYPNNALVVTMKEYIIYNGVKFVLVNPPTIVREGMVSDNGELKGMTKYSFVFYHPMYMLANFPFSDVAVSSGQQLYLSENKTFFWIGNLVDYVAKINKNLENTEWHCVISANTPNSVITTLSDVLSFDNSTIADAFKTGYETWGVPYIVDVLKQDSQLYINGKRFIVQFGLPTMDILDTDDQPFVFKFGQGVGLKNNSRTPKNNKIITRIAGYGSEDNIQYGYPQIPYEGGDCQYPLYYGIVGGQRVQLIKHPFTRSHLMPSIYRETVNKKVNPMATGYDPTIELKDYYDADNTYDNPIKPLEPSYEIHEFDKIKPELGQMAVVSVSAYSDKDLDSISLSSFLSFLSEYYTETEYIKEKEELEKIINTIGTMSSNSGSVNTRAYYCDWAFTKDERYAYVKFESSALNFEYTVLMVSPSQDVEWDDTMDDDGKYVQSYFKITIPQLAFDLYASAAITQKITINMRSGACLGCSFPVMADWDDYKMNFYDSDGNFAPSGSQRNYDKYPDSSQGQITLILQKETSTFGTLMPNTYQKPHAGDEFVILGISIPQTYVTDAESRLDVEMKQYMRENNTYYYEYPLKFDEYFLATHTNILSQMKPNIVVRFEYANEVHRLYIKQMSVKYENKPLPTYDITLTDDVEIVLNSIGRAIDDLSKMRFVGSGGSSIDGENYLRKDIDDTANGTIRMIKGMQVGERFVTGLLGEGGVFRKEDDGTTYIEADKLYIRMKAYFDTVEIRHFLHSAGNRVASCAGIKCSRVEYIKANGDATHDVQDAVLFRCYFRANDDGQEVRNDFVVGDLAFCKETNAQTDSIEQHGYWRAVVGRNTEGVLTNDGEGWIDLSASDCMQCSDIPIAQDDIIQLGNKTNTDRQGAIVEFVSGADSPSYQIFQGINDYNLNNKNYIGLGYSSQNARAYLNVYGDAYVGDPNESTYIKYNAGTRQLDIKAKISAQSTIGDETLEQFIAENTWTEEQINSLITAETDTFNYIKQALAQKTDIEGGLILTSLIALRDGNSKIWSGINGAYSSSARGGGIAAWFGGAMVDKEVSPTATDYAKSLFRFDGSGYVANGNIAWDATGLTTVSVSSVAATSISINGKGVATEEWVNNNYISIAFFNRLFRAYNGSTQVNPNDTTSTIDNIKAMFGFWTQQYISALGEGSGGSGGGVTMAQVWSALGNATNEQINASHLTTALSGYNPTNNFKTINGNSIIGVGNITIESSGDTVTAVKVGSTSYSPINGVVSLPDYLKLSGGTMTGDIITPADDNLGIRPSSNNYGQIGTSSYKFYRMYASTFYGELDGTISNETRGSFITSNNEFNFIPSTYTRDDLYLNYKAADNNDSSTAIKNYVFANGKGTTLCTITANGAQGANQTSDIRLKNVKEYFALGIDDVANAPLIKFTLKNDADAVLRVGSIAQYWQKVLPETVFERTDGYLAIKEDSLALACSISVARKVQDHERRISELESENKRLKRQLEDKCQ